MSSESEIEDDNIIGLTHWKVCKIASDMPTIKYSSNIL